MIVRKSVLVIIVIAVLIGLSLEQNEMVHAEEPPPVCSDFGFPPTTCYGSGYDQDPNKGSAEHGAVKECEETLQKCVGQKSSLCGYICTHGIGVSEASLTCGAATTISNTKTCESGLSCSKVAVTSISIGLGGIGGSDPKFEWLCQAKGQQDVECDCMGVGDILKDIDSSQMGGKGVQPPPPQPGG